MVDEALAKSRDGNIVTRVARDLTGGEENAQVPARVTYDQDAVDALVKRVERGLNRQAARRPGRLPVARRRSRSATGVAGERRPCCASGWPRR